MKFVTCTILVFNFYLAYSQGTQKLARLYSNSKRDQFIEFTHLDDLQFEVGQISYRLSAVSSCGLPVEYNSSDTSIAAIGNSRVFVKRPGKVTISAFQKGNTYFNSANTEKEIFSSRLPQTIDVGQISDVLLEEGEIRLIARCTSRLPVEFYSKSSCIKIIGDKIILLKEGEVVLEAKQLGNQLFLPSVSSIKFSILPCGFTKKSEPLINQKE